MIQQADIDKLRIFHAAHFPGQPIPNLSDPRRYVTEESSLDQFSQVEGDDGLGYYADGVKRTLTDEQIKMFRHSEIQRLLSERREKRKKDKREEIRQGGADKMSKAIQTRKRRFEDEPERQHNNVDTLTYDDFPNQRDASVKTPKKFLWPLLR